MQWFRHYHGASFDPKFRTAARRAGSSIERTVFVFWALCEYAAEQDENGSIEGFDPEPVADHLGCNVTDVTGNVDALQGLVHDGCRLTGWSRRQRPSDDTAARVRRWRERKKDDVTLRNGNSNACNEQNRAEQNREEKKDSMHASPNGAAEKRGSRLPADWSLGDVEISEAKRMGLTDSEVRAEADRFVDYWIAQPGQRGVKKDWLATWRNWCRTASQRPGRTKTQANRSPPPWSTL